MRFIFLFFLFFLSSWGVNLVDYKFEEKDDKLHIILFFDGVYDGDVFQKKDGNKFVLTLRPLKFDKQIGKEFTKGPFKSVYIEPGDEYVDLNIISDIPSVLKVNKDDNGFSLKIKLDLEKPLNLSEKEYGNINFSYLLVLIILILIILMLFILKKFIDSKNIQNFGSKSKIRVLYQKVLDRQNRIVLLSYEDARYLILLGNSNLLLDKLTKNQDKEFDSFLDENKINNALNNYKSKI